MIINEKELKTLIQAMRIYRKYKGMGFSIEKCAILIMKSGKRQMAEEIERQNQARITTFGEKEIYKHLGVLEVDTIKKAEMKEKIFKVLGITHLFPHNELVHRPYIAVATNTRVD